MLRSLSLIAAAGGNRWDHMDGWGGGWMWLWGIAMMAMIAALVVWLVRASTGSTGTGGTGVRDPTDRGREILAERYAKGELTTEEYRARVNELR